MIKDKIEVKDLARKVGIIVKRCGDVVEEEGLPREIGVLAALGMINSMLKMFELHIQKEDPSFVEEKERGAE